MKQEFQDIVRYHINRVIYDQGFAPDVSELSDLTGKDNQEVEGALEDLVRNHALVLHPNNHKIWIAHPFSLMPTAFWVESKHQGWYSNCTWCSLGVASLVDGGNVTIYTKLNGTRDGLAIHIEDGKIVEDHLLVHFLIPPVNFWDNVIYTCSNMLPFDSEEAIDNWCISQNVSKNEVQPINRVWELAKEWYGYYLSPDWKRKTPEEARAIFDKVGLTGSFWQI